MPRIERAPHTLRDDDLPFDEDLPELVAAVVLGEKIERALTDITSPFSMMIAKARAEFIEATLSLIDADKVDLSTANGVAQARSLQAKAHRYLTMCRWISEANADADEAETQIEEADAEGEPAIEELKEQFHGKRAKPAPDA